MSDTSVKVAVRLVQSDIGLLCYEIIVYITLCFYF